MTYQFQWNKGGYLLESEVVYRDLYRITLDDPSLNIRRATVVSSILETTVAESKLKMNQVLIASRRMQ